MSDLQESETPLHNQIVRELIELTPETWKVIELTISCDDPANDGSLVFEISNPDDAEEFVGASDALFDAGEELARLYRDRGHPWREVKYVVTQQPSGKWSFKAAYSYA
jgi:hypothetical protein